MLEAILGSLLGSLVWITANLAYRSYIRDGERGFKRLAAFCLGWPYTLVSAVVIRRTRRVAAEPRRDEWEEERRLLMEIRQDRARRIARGREGDDGGGNEGA